MKRAKIIKNKDGSKSLVIKLGDATETSRLASLFNYTPVTDYVNDIKDFQWWDTETYMNALTTEICNALTSAGGNPNLTDEVSVAIRKHPTSKY